MSHPNPTPEERIAEALERIADALEICTDQEKKALRMFDVERANVYKTHLGGKLRPEGGG